MPQRDLVLKKKKTINGAVGGAGRKHNNKKERVAHHGSKPQLESTVVAIMARRTTRENHFHTKTPCYFRGTLSPP